MWARSLGLCVVVVMVTKLVISSPIDEQLEKDEIIDAVNNANTTWKAGRNFHPSLTESYYKFLLGLILEDRDLSKLSELPDNEDDTELPENFDARDKWQHCVSLQTVRDQSDCGSCWAVSSASVFSDRLCIASKGRFNSELSAQNLMSCGPGYGCDGGFPEEAFEYFEADGIVTGGDYDSHEGCQPYTLPRCDHHVTGKYKNCSSIHATTPKCQTTCYNKDYHNKSYKEDLHKIKSGSSFTITGHIKKMQKEIYKNGPLVAGFGVYEDFFSYKSGVYQYTKGELKGGHAVRVVGWGVEDGTPYWLVSNSWNSDWGDKGYFKIRRGTNECGFEDGMVAGVPKVD